MAKRAEKNAAHRETNRKTLALEAALLLLLLRASRSKNPARAIESALLDFRQRARVLGRERVAAQLGATASARKPPVGATRLVVRRVDMGDGTYKEFISTHPSTFRPFSRTEQARVRTLSRDVAADATKRTRAAQDSADARAAREAARASTEARLRNIAATETFSAFNAEQQATAEAYSSATGIALEKEWSAVLDLRTCEACTAVDGQRVALRERFDAPGPPAHPRCRCVVLYSVA